MLGGQDIAGNAAKEVKLAMINTNAQLGLASQVEASLECL